MSHTTDEAEGWLKTVVLPRWNVIEHEPHRREGIVFVLQTPSPRLHRLLDGLFSAGIEAANTFDDWIEGLDDPATVVVGVPRRDAVRYVERIPELALWCATKAKSGLARVVLVTGEHVVPYSIDVRIMKKAKLRATASVYSGLEGRVREETANEFLALNRLSGPSCPNRSPAGATVTPLKRVKIPPTRCRAAPEALTPTCEHRPIDL